MRAALLNRLNSPRVSLLIPAALYFLLLVAQILKHDYDISHFVQAGDFFVNPAQAPANLSILHNSLGYDGQFYYRLAITPFTNERTAFGVTLDTPYYRQQRIGYPLLAWLFSLGRPGLVPFALVLVNYVCLCLMGWLGGVYAQSINRHALWGVVFPLYPGFILVLMRDLTEITELFFLLAAFVCMHLNLRRRTILFLALAVLTKETALLAVMVLLISHRVDKWYHIFKPRLQLLPVLLFGFWQGWLCYQWGWGLSRDFQNNIGYPFIGYLSFFRETSLLSNHWQYVWFIELCVIMAFTIVIVYTGLTVDINIDVKLSWIFYLILVYLLTRSVWVEDWAFLRACSEFYLFGVMILLNSRAKWQNVVLAADIVCWSLLAIDVFRMR
jgi:hypothetical protein